VVGSRYVEHGSVATFSQQRAFLSGLATRIAHSVLQVPDPMSGFFMVRHEAFQGLVRRLSSIRFKILLDNTLAVAGPEQAERLAAAIGPRSVSFDGHSTLPNYLHSVCMPR
jgi:dolichol-phosphate mannosyltransferase